jgi:hypothetical protein
MPAGIEIIIAIEKPKAIITSKARILRREIFLKALLTMPNHITTEENFWFTLENNLMVVFIGLIIYFFSPFRVFSYYTYRPISLGVRESRAAKKKGRIILSLP